MVSQSIMAGSVWSILGLVPAIVTATIIAPVDLDSLPLGAKIVGPVGPDVETSLNKTPEESIGDLSSSVSCPDGFSECIPSNHAPGTIFTYVHQVTPGVDLPNDPPFPMPDTVTAFDDVIGFNTGFSAEGFNGVAGYSFSEATAALGASDAIEIEQLGDGSLSWTITNSQWDTGELLSFFWQTTQPPSGPGGVYSITNGAMVGSGNGPLPTALPIPLPATGGMWLVMLYAWRVSFMRYESFKSL